MIYGYESFAKRVFKAVLYSKIASEKILYKIVDNKLDKLWFFEHFCDVRYGLRVDCITIAMSNMNTGFRFQ